MKSKDGAGIRLQNTPQPEDIPVSASTDLTEATRMKKSNVQTHRKNDKTELGKLM